ncbi:ATP-dependent helicase [Pseudomonas sp. WHRI 8822A]|uniref:ATP-dependent helicase n=1 Tax=Pseudomonas sp. WHRI 8822A TaxID=3162568 RepID=UPI0032EE6400
MIKVEDWIPSDGIVLEPNAVIAAKEQARCVALTAGPGSGKSELLAQRADFLLTTGVCRYPKRILAIAFKVDASNNLKERVWRRCGAAYAGRFDSYTFHGLAKRIVERFRPVLTGADALNPGFKVVANGKAHPVQTEFKALIPLAIKILEAYPPAVNAIRQTYSDVFLDEFQDCTDEQYELVTRLFKCSGRRVTAVGDVKQKIMGWAGALDGVFAKFVDDFGAEHLNIYRNFRSLPHLLKLQNEIIKVLDPESEMPAHLLAGEGGEVHMLHYPGCEDEARDLAERISHWINVEGIAPAEIAILTRAQPEAYCLRLTAELDRRGISYRNENKAQDISTEPIAQVIVDYLLCMYGLREPKAWIRLTHRVIPAEEDSGGKLKRSWSRYIKEARKLAAADMASKTYAQRWELLEEFLSMVGPTLLAGLSHEYESRDYLRELIEDVKTYIDEAMAKEHDLLQALAQLSNDQSVRILTVHKSKGLEFDTVVLLGVEHQSYFGNLHESRCTFFVGVSRAKRRLVVTAVDHRANLGGVNRWRASRTAQDEFLGYVNLWTTYSNQT